MKEYFLYFISENSNEISLMESTVYILVQIEAKEEAFHRIDKNNY